MTDTYEAHRQRVKRMATNIITKIGVGNMIIEKLLAKKHESDFCIFQCKTGETHGAKNGELGIADCLVMKKSWSNPCIKIYEIKVSRGDYFGEIKREKYKKYLPYCNEFGYIVPRGMITIDELPDKDFGLYYCGENTIYTKNKAKYFKKEIPASIFQYILMNKIESDRYPFHKDKIDYINDYLEQKEMRWKLGRIVSDKIYEELEFLNQFRSICKNHYGNPASLWQQLKFKLHHNKIFADILKSNKNLQ